MAEPRRSLGARVFNQVSKASGHLGLIGSSLLAIVLITKMRKMEEEISEHRAGLCGRSDDMIAENRRLKDGLMSLRQRVLDEVNRDEKRLPPLPSRLKNIFDSLH